MLVQEAAKPFDPQSFLEGHMTPVFFGSALRHFGVDQLLEGLGAYAPPPKAVPALKSGEEIHVAPGDREVSGFVFAGGDALAVLQEAWRRMEQA